MSEERLNNIPGRMPSSVYEQLALMNNEREGESEEICRQLAKEIRSILDENFVNVFSESFRVKTRESIVNKSLSRGSEEPIRDRFGGREEVAAGTYKRRVAEAIQKRYPLTPKVFPDGTPSIRDYADPKVREEGRKRNKNISERYSAMHVNIVFQRPGHEVYYIAEIQLLDTDEMRVFNETRPKYERDRRK